MPGEEREGKMDSINIMRATAIYTGGNIYCYYAELIDGNWIMGGEDFLIIVDTNPLADEWNSEFGCESDYLEWQEKHLVKEISEEDYQKYLNAILDEIFNGNTIEEYNNFSLDELKDRYE